MNLFLLLVSACFCSLRVALPSSGIDRGDIFKDLAHVWVGLILGAAIVTTHYKLPPRVYLWALFLLLIAVEVGAGLLKG